MYLCSLQAPAQTLLNTCVVMIQHFTLQFGDILWPSVIRTYCVALTLNPPKVWFIKVGESRCWFSRSFFKNRLLPLLSDHTISVSLPPWFFFFSFSLKCLSLTSKCQFLEGLHLKCSSSLFLWLISLDLPRTESSTSPLFYFEGFPMLLCC